MSSFHRILIKLRTELGYKYKYYANSNKSDQDDGLCVLYAEEANDACLLGEFESVFIKRCQYIEKNYNQFAKLFHQAKEQVKSKAKQQATMKPNFSVEELQMIFDVAAFFDQGELILP